MSLLEARQPLGQKSHLKVRRYQRFKHLTPGSCRRQLCFYLCTCTSASLVTGMQCCILVFNW